MEENDKLIVKSMEEVMHDSMIPYSEYVIMDRALPRVEDGLKPVQRRVLYSMFDLGITPDKPHKKSARIVGDCLGKYHPHGDTSIYQAMVRLAQPFNMSCILVDGHGNFGSIDGDGAAAMRYTEARLTPLALQLINDIEKDTVKWSPNFDDSTTEPDFLPGRFPNLLVNGASGIAVGLATNIPPHNLAEAIDGVIAYIANPKISLKEMMKYIKGPDFPTGAVVIANELEKAYETGRGKILIRAKIHIENGDNDKKLIVIDEFPYQVNKSALLKDILDLREEKKDKLSGISDITDESDRNGIRAVIKVKKDADPQAILAMLFKCTNLQTTFGINMVAIADGKPQQMGLLDIIAYYVDYQRVVIVKRTRFELDQAKDRVHILEGLVTAVRNIDEVVKIIKASKNTTEAKENLKARFELSEKQAQAIIDLRLGRLTSLEIYKLEKELEELKALIEKLSEILGSKKLQFEVIKTELLAIKKQFKTGRKSSVIDSVENYLVACDDDEKQVEDYVVALNVLGELKKMSTKSFNLATKDFTDTSTKSEFCPSIVAMSSNMKLFCFTNLGNCIKLTADDIPDAKWREKVTAPQPKALTDGERIIHIVPVGEKIPEGELMFYSKQGMVKKTPWTEYDIVKYSFQAAKIKDGDEIIAMENFRQGASLMFITRAGMCLNAEMADIPSQGRISNGVKGVKLSENDECVAVAQSDGKGYVAMVTSNGYAKNTPANSIDIIGRYSKGVRVIDLKAGAELKFAKLIKEEVKLVIESGDEFMQAYSTSAFPVENRTHGGKPLFRGKCDVVRVMIYGDKIDS